MDNGVKFSIIIPIYNAEKYLIRAVESVLSQECDDAEIILVDDGSTDKSGVLCDELKEKYKNISVVHKENGGISTARNAGLSRASGQYIVFLDSDDFLEKDFFEKISWVSSQYNADLVDYGYKYVFRDASYMCVHHKTPKNVLLDEEYIRRKIIPPYINLCKDEDNFIYSFSWNKIYKRSLIEKYNIRFKEDRRTWEDRLFVAEYLKYCRTFYSMDEHLYNYVNVENSLSRQFDVNYLQIIVSSYLGYKKLYEEDYEFNTEYVNNYWYESIDRMIASQLQRYGDKPEVRESVINILKNPLVIGWMKNKPNKNRFDAKVISKVEDGQYRRVVGLYQRRNLTNGTKNKVMWVKNRLLGFVKRFVVKLCPTK